MQPSYRQWLSDRAVNGSNSAVRQQASALLNVVGNDGGINRYFIQDPVAYAASRPGGSPLKDSTQGQIAGYGPSGMTAINNEMWSAYNSPNRQYGPGEGNSQNVQVLGAGTGGGASAPAYNQATVDQFDSGISSLESALGRLPGQLNIARQNVGDQYNTTVNRLNSARNAAENQYNQSSTGNMQSLRTNKNNILDQQSQGLRGLLRTLGMYGAVGSDATLASEAVANEATRQRSGAGSVFAQNQRALDTNWGNFKNEDKDRRKEAQDWRTRQIRQAEQQSAQTKQDLLSRLAELRGQRAATIGGSFKGAAQPYLDRANALSSRIDSLGRFKPTFDGKTPVYQAPTLDSYNLGAGPTIEAGGQAQTATPTLNALLGLGNDDEERRF